MQKIILNAELHMNLPSLTVDTLLVDENGKWVGLFVPADEMYRSATQEVILNANIDTILPTLTDSALILAEDGKLVGKFITVERLIPPISNEELLRRANSNEKGITTAELLAKLKAL